MYRKINQDLFKWKASSDRKPLVLFGARQTGKTWILKEFGKNEYDNIAYINCDNNPIVSAAFTDFDIERLIRVFSAVTNEKILPEKTLIILDEIQEIPLALTSLKYFSENAPEYHIAVAGSLLGISVRSGTGYPVGKVNELFLHPMSFSEFLMAMDKKAFVQMMMEKNWEEIKPFRETFKELLRQYYYTGGMPEVVQKFVQNHDLKEVRRIQKRIVNEYKQDFSKHVPSDQLAKVNMVWDSIPSQLAKENKKFIYGSLKKGSRAKEFEDAIQWLIDAGLVHRVNRITKFAMPLKFYEDLSGFKLFLNDLGLLQAMADVPAAHVLVGDKIFEEYKGAFTEQYVHQQMIADEIKPYYFTNENSTLKIDFVIQDDAIHPIEVKSEENLKSKSLKTVTDAHKGMHGWRFSMSDYREQEWLTNIPLYCAECWFLPDENM